MKYLADILINKFELLQSCPEWIIYLGVMLFFGFILLFGVCALSSGFNTYLERRISGRMQSRVGCNRVGPEGLIQFAADGLKLILKEDIIPKSADSYLFRLAPHLVFMGCFLGFAVIPFSDGWTFANLNIGLFYVLSVGSLAVVGVLMSGWSSNNKWALLGAVRSTAQIISYEIPVALTLMVPVLLASTLNLNDIALAQQGGIFNWFANPFKYPFGFIAAVILFTAYLAELNRTPFDLPEAESELVSGYNTEYSGIRFGVFFTAEFANIFLAAAIFATAFMGGYTRSILDIPFATVACFFGIVIAIKVLSWFQNLVFNTLKDPKNFFIHVNNSQPEKLPRWLMGIIWIIGFVTATFIYAIEPAVEKFLLDIPVLRIGFFIIKIYILVFIIMWLRWTLPRFRVDQLMKLCWTQMIPLAFITAVGTAVLMVIF